MSEEKRKEITVMLCHESFYDILDQKTPLEVIERMKELMDGYPDRKISFNVSPYGYDGGLELELWEHRLENDKEFAKRMKEQETEKAKTKKAKEMKEAKELAEFTRLKKKFEGKSAFSGSI